MKNDKKIEKKDQKGESEQQRNDDIVKNVVKSKRTKRDKYFFVSKSGL